MYVDVHWFMTQTMSVTDLRKNIFDVVMASKVNKQITEIMLHGEVVARIVPNISGEFDWDQYKIGLEKAVERLSKYDWSDVLENRKKVKFRKYKGW